MPADISSASKILIGFVVGSEQLRKESVANMSFCDIGCVGRMESYAPPQLTPRTSSRDEERQ